MNLRVGRCLIANPGAARFGCKEFRLRRYALRIDGQARRAGTLRPYSATPLALRQVGFAHHARH